MYYNSGRVISHIPKGKKSVVFDQLPSAVRGVPARRWAIEDLEFRPMGLCHDHEQGLVVLIENWYEL